MSLKKVLRLAAMLACLISVLTSGCADMASLNKEPVTIQFATFGGDEYFEPLIEAFHKKFPYITIELSDFQPFGPPQSDEEVDVMMTSQFMLRFMLEQEIPMSLNTLMSEDDEFDLNDFYRGGVDAFSTEGQRWAIPFMADMLVMYYNKDLFDQAGVPYPEIGWTWEQFEQKAIALSAADRGQYGYAYQFMGQIGQLEPMLWMYQAGGALYDDLSSPTRMTINNSNNVMAMQWWADLIYQDHAAPPPGERRQPYPDSGIEGGKYAMWMGWMSDEREGINVGYAPLPSFQTSATMGAVVGFMITADADDPKACWEWVKFLSEQTPPSLVPLRRSIAESDKMEASGRAEMIAVGRASLENFLPYNFSMEGEFSKTWGQSMSAFTGAISSVLAGEPVQETLDKAQAKTGF